MHTSNLVRMTNQNYWFLPLHCVQIVCGAATANTETVSDAAVIDFCVYVLN